MKEKISVIIPAYNASEYLEKAVSSVRMQKYDGEIEIIIIDDGSEDDTLSIAQTVGDVVLTQKKAGAASARNKGIKVATGDFIFFLDADDELVKETFQNLREPFYHLPDLKIVFSRAKDFVSPELTEQEKKALKVRPTSYGGVLPGCALIKKEVFDQIGLFDESLTSGETVAWQMKVRDENIDTISLDFISLNRRLHLTNTGRVEAKQEMRNYAQLIRERMGKK